MSKEKKFDKSALEFASDDFEEIMEEILKAQNEGGSEEAEKVAEFYGFENTGETSEEDSK